MLPAVIDARRALDPDAAVIRTDIDGKTDNHIFDWEAGDQANWDANVDGTRHAIELANRIEQPFAMPHRRDAELLEVVGAQPGEHVAVDVVFGKGARVSRKTQALEPGGGVGRAFGLVQVAFDYAKSKMRSRRWDGSADGWSNML